MPSQFERPHRQEQAVWTTQPSPFSCGSSSRRRPWRASVRHTWATHAPPAAHSRRNAAKQRPGFQTSRSLIEIALDVGYTSSSHFAQVFWRVVGNAHPVA